MDALLIYGVTVKFTFWVRTLVLSLSVILISRRYVPFREALEGNPLAGLDAAVARRVEPGRPSCRN